MLSCVQLYLSKELVKAKYVNLDLKKVENNTRREFVEFMNEVEIDKEQSKKNLFDQFKELYPDFCIIRQNTFTKWLKCFAKFKDLKYSERKSGSEIIFNISKEN